MKLRAIANRATFGLYDEAGTRIASINNGITGQERVANRLAVAFNSHDALVNALERLLHPMADDDDIIHAQEVLRSLKGE